jgi:hypothetical protein
MFPGLLLIAPASFGLELKHTISCKFAYFSVRICCKETTYDPASSRGPEDE